MVHTGGLKPRGKGVSECVWSCAPAPCGCAVPVQYAPVDCLLCCVLFSSLLSRLCCSPPTTCLQMGWLRGAQLPAKTGQSSPPSEQLAVLLHGPPSSLRY